MTINNIYLLQQILESPEDFMNRAIVLLSNSHIAKTIALVST